MNIGLVSTWFERGAAYVTKSYMNLLKKDHNVFIYARGGEAYGKGDSNWDMPNVTWGLKLGGDIINYSHFKKWVRSNKLDVVFFNEQRDVTVLHKLKRDFPQIKLGAYIDYYKEDTVKEFDIYDFLICNTKRHYSVFKNHPQCYYVPWGTDTDLFKPKESYKKELTFIHSAGMSTRKGTNFVIDAFIEGEIYKQAKLIIHTQKPIDELFGYNKEKLKKFNIEVIEKTVPAPGLYHLGDVYVYPTTLDGLGLTMYEALSCGLPIIATNHPPMNEIVNNSNGYLVEVDYLRSRSDGYYWPLSIVKKESLIDAMNYFIENKDKLNDIKKRNRQEAIKKWEWKDRYKIINEIFVTTKVIVNNENLDKISISDRTKLRKFIRELKASNLYKYFYPILKLLFK